MCSWWLTTRPDGVTPSAAVSRRRRRVSSAATTSASARSRASRAGASSGSPMGVAARTSRPVGVGSAAVMPRSSQHPPLRTRPVRGHGWVGDLRCPGERTRGGRRAPPRERADGDVADPGPSRLGTGEGRLRRHLLGFTPSDRLWGWVGPLLVTLLAGRDAVLAPAAPAQAGVRRDVLRQAGVHAVAERLREPVAEGVGRPVHHRQHRDLPRRRRPRGAPAGRQVDDRRRGVAVRHRLLVRLAVRRRGDRHADGADHRPHRPAPARLDAARVDRRAAAGRGRPPPGAQPHQPARHLPVVLGAVRLLAARAGPRAVADQAGRGGGDGPRPGTARRARPVARRCGRCGWRRRSAWAWRSA